MPVVTSRWQRPARTPPPAADTPSRDEVIAVCQTYIDALFTGDGSSVLLAPDAWRIENGRDMGDSGPAIQQMLTQMLGDGPKVVTGMDDLRWYVEGEEAVAFYTLEIDPRLGTSGQRPAPSSCRCRSSSASVCTTA